MSGALKVDNTIWRFDENRRRYTKPRGEGKIFGEPIYKAHWDEVQIVGENRVSWLLGHGERPIWKAPKKGPHPGFAFEYSEVLDDCLVNDRHKIAHLVQSCRDAATLRKVAELIGWKP